VLFQLTRALAATTAGLSMPTRLCAAFADVAGVDGAALSMAYAPAERSVLSATDELAELIEDAEEVLREGPSIEACRLRRAVVSDEDDIGTRWPLLAEHFGARAMNPRLLAFPMMPHSELIGVLSAYQLIGRPLPLRTEETQFLADAIGVALLGDLAPDSYLDERWSIRDVISQATGMVVAQLALSPSDAMAVLRAHAFAEGVTVSDVSRRIVDRSLTFRPPPKDGGS